jgi:branched-chain amino acid transport system substrate-binding protein
MLRLKALVASLAAAAAFVPAVHAQEPIKVGVVTFLSGPAAGPFGVPARNAAEIIIEMMNGGKIAAPYDQKGFGGAPLQMVLIDEAGSTTTQVTEFRNLVQRSNVDVVIGYISSGNCLAIAPVAEELKKLTNFFDCGTPRIFEEGSYKYVFRTSPHSTSDSVGAALYLKSIKPQVKTIAGINQNYAWGQDSWADFENAMKQLVPSVKTTTSQMPKLFAGQYGAEISALLSSNSDAIHSSFWDGDLEAFILQAAPRGLFKKSTVILTTGETVMHKPLAAQIPDGTVLGARGPFGPYAPDTALNKWFVSTFKDRYNVPPNYAAYQMAQAIMGVKLAWEKAQAAKGGQRPTNEEVSAALENMTYESPGGIVRMALGKGHQAVMETAYGQTKLVKGQLTIANIRRFPAEQVNPPEGMKSADWIANGFKAK